VLWKTGLPSFRSSRSFRDPKSNFGLYPHLGADHTSPHYVYVAGRSYDSRFYRTLLAVWHTKWRLQRWLREVRVNLK
jgi:hypothetical protein